MHALACRVTVTPGYRILEVRHAWSAVGARQIEAEDRRASERLLHLSENQFDSHLIGARQPAIGEITTAQTTAQSIHTMERAAATSNS